MRNLFLFLFAAVSLLEVYAEYTGSPSIRHFAKPLLMPLLLGWYISSFKAGKQPVRKWVIATLVFSWLGDVFLMFLPVEGLDDKLWGIERNEQFFLAGLGSFLLAHVFYILAFALPFRGDSQKGIITSKPWIGILLLVYGFGLIYWLLPHLGDFRIPVIIYACVIMLMVLFATNRFGRISEGSFWATFLGALLFMLSDSMIAINKWPAPFELAPTLIMITYISGQWGIVAGLVWGERG